MPKRIEWLVSATEFRRRVAQFYTDIVVDGAILMLMNNTKPWGFALSTEAAMRAGITLPDEDRTISQTYLKDNPTEIGGLLEEHGTVAIRKNRAVEILLVSIDLGIKHGLAGEYLLIGPHLVEQVARRVAARLDANQRHPQEHPVTEIQGLVEQLVKVIVRENP